MQECILTTLKNTFKTFKKEYKHCNIIVFRRTRIKARPCFLLWRQEFVEAHSSFNKAPTLKRKWFLIDPISRRWRVCRNSVPNCPTFAQVAKYKALSASPPSYQLLLLSHISSHFTTVITFHIGYTAVGIHFTTVIYTTAGLCGGSKCGWISTFYSGIEFILPYHILSLIRENSDC